MAEWESLNERLEQQQRSLQLYKLYCSDKWLTRTMEDINRIEEELARLSSEIVAVTDGKKAVVQSNVDFKETRLSEIRKSVSKLRTELKDCETAITGFNIGLEASSAALISRLKDHVNLELKIDEFSAQLREMRLAFDNKKNDLETEIMKFNSAKEVHGFSTLDRDRKIEYLKDREEVAGRSRMLNLQLENLNDRIQNQNDRKSAAMIDLEAIEDEISRLNKELHEKQEIPDYNKSSLDDQCAALSVLKDAKEADLDCLDKKIDEAERELHTNTSLVDFMSSHEDVRSVNLTKTIQRLQATFPGIHGRIYDLCELRDHRYGKAVSSALGASENSVVVNTSDVARECIEKLREWKERPIEFIPLTTWHRTTGSLESTRSHFTTIIDLIDIKDSQFLPAFERILADTVLAENLSDARAIAFQKAPKLGLVVKVVSLDGQIIFKNSNIKLAASGRNKFSAKQKELALQKCATLQNKLNDLNASRQQLSQKIVSLDNELNIKLRDQQQLSLDIASHQAYLENLVVSLERSEALRDKLDDVIRDKELIKLEEQRNHIREQLKKSVLDVEAHQLHESYIDLVKNHERQMEQISAAKEAVEIRIVALARNIGLPTRDITDAESFILQTHEFLHNKVPLIKSQTTIDELRTKCRELEVEIQKHRETVDLLNVSLLPSLSISIEPTRRE